MRTLTQIGRETGTDKIGPHTYLPIYEQYFDHLRHKPIRLLEIGYGGWSSKNGYNEPNLGGESALMFATYFDHPDSEIIIIDIQHKNIPKNAPFKYFQGSQSDADFIRQFTDINILIDDGSHRSEDQITTFETMFPLMPDGGIYVIEDTQTSSWPELSPGRKATDYFKERTDRLNYKEIRGGREGDYFDEHIFSIHFYHNLIFIFKGDNTEPSNSHD